jgi:hypothetical protein
MSLVQVGPLLVVGLFAGVLVSLELGRRLGRRHLASAEGAHEGFGAVEGAIFGLLGLMVAFTFSGAASRFDDRRHLVTEEANAIGTAWLRIDLAAAEAQPRLRDSFRRYLDSRLETYRRARDLDAAMAEFARSTAIQGEIWGLAVTSCRAPDAAPSACVLMLPALNAMIDIATTRLMAVRVHPPLVVFGMLVALTLAGALMAGHAMAAARTRSWVHALGFAAVMALTICVIVDFEYPRLGFIRVDSADEVLVDLRKSMGEAPPP